MQAGGKTIAARAAASHARHAHRRLSCHAARSMMASLRADEMSAPPLIREAVGHPLGLRVAPGAGMTSAGALWGGLVLVGGLVLLGVLRFAPTCRSATAESPTLLQRCDGGLAVRHRAISTLRDTWRALSADQPLQQIREERP
jgi:hypothetical protein